jgi:hypothetical protein
METLDFLCLKNNIKISNKMEIIDKVWRRDGN